MYKKTDAAIVVEIMYIMFNHKLIKYAQWRDRFHQFWKDGFTAVFCCIQILC